MSKEYNAKQAAKFLNVSDRTLAAYRQKNKIPFAVKKVPTTVLVESTVFVESDLIAFKKARDAKRNPPLNTNHTELNQVTSRQTQSAEGSL